MRPLNGDGALQEINPNNYQQQLDEKLAKLNSSFAELALPNIDIHTSEPLHFRMRAEFRIWHENGSAHFAMNQPGEKRPYIIEDFPIGSQQINQLMPLLLAEINVSEILSRRLFSAEFLTTLSGEALITLIYHKPLNDEWQEVALKLQQQLGVAIIGRSRKQKTVLDRDYVIEKLHVSGKEYQYQQVETGFTQPNAGVNQKMLEWALKQSTQCSGDLVELYCGNGNFTCVLAQNFNRVLATEISKISVRSAQYNFEANGIDNVTVVRMSSEEFTEALNGVRPFRRLKDIDLDSYNFSTIFVDPPRAGLDDATVALVKRFDNIIYVSCNPATLKANLEALSDTHSIESFAVFDQFPYTRHLESGVFLVKKLS
ncbi:MAG: tRNA (uridine(54)-C5)-methyltransferase TrmA [Porticoccus sp.]|nr:tRNA (uridine(54)-C5)-methyltransferase TrmA [Porticoccus sp.]MBQ0808162.1 tRNA (uridine(54)-C5)-methyltransferase TrmA [Porticoccus sp.]